jgi:hypothetical protein
MSFTSMLLQITLWLGIYAAWFYSTRQFHPTLSLELLATGVLVAASAIAVYINTLVLVPRLFRPGSRWKYWGALTATILLLDLLAVLSIQFAYDRIWGPDPLRFGFWFNMASDGFIIALHVAGAAGLGVLARMVRARSAPPFVLERGSGGMKTGRGSDRGTRMRTKLASPKTRTQDKSPPE